MTKHEAAVFTIFTGIAFLKGEDLSEMYRYAAELMGRPVYSHELPKLADELKERARPEFMKICSEVTDNDPLSKEKQTESEEES